MPNSLKIALAQHLHTVDSASLMLGVGVGSYVIGLLVGSMPIASLYLYFSALPVLTFVLMLMSSRTYRSA